jgi:WD40 repeat protein
MPARCLLPTGIALLFAAVSFALGQPKPTPTADGSPGPVSVLEARPALLPVVPRPETRDWFDVMRIHSVAFSGDGKRILTSTFWGVTLRDATTGAVLFEQQGGGSGRNWPWVAPAANVALLPAKNGITVLDMATGKLKSEVYPGLRPGAFPHTNPTAIAIASDASLYALIAMEHPESAESHLDKTGKKIGLPPDHVVVGELRTGKTKFTLKPQFEPPPANRPPNPKEDSPKTWGIEFSNDGKYLAAITDDGCVTVWDMASGAETAVFRAGRPFGPGWRDSSHRLTWVGDHDYVIVPAAFSPGFVRCDLDSKSILPQRDPEPVGAPSTPKGKKKGKKPAKPPMPRPAPVEALKPGRGPDSNDIYAFSTDGSYLLQISHDFIRDGHRNLYLSNLDDAKAGGTFAEIKGDRAWSLAFSHDSELVAIGTNRGNVLIYRCEDLDQLAGKGGALDPGLKRTPLSEDDKVVAALVKQGFEIRGTPVTGLQATAKANNASMKLIGQLHDLETLNLAGTKITDHGLSELKSLSKLRVLVLDNTTISDSGIKELAGLTALQQLRLRDTKITDAGLKELRGLQNLEMLSLDWTPIGDAGVKELLGLKKLGQLNLARTNLSDKGLFELRGLPSLHHLYVQNTKVTAAGVKQLQTARPRLNIAD